MIYLQKYQFAINSYIFVNNMPDINKDGIKLRQISSQVFSKFKKVRQLESYLYGHYGLYSKNGLKYLGKHLPSNYQLFTTRNLQYPIFKNTNKEQTIYLFPLHGQPLSSFLIKANQEGQIKGWIQKCGSIESCLWQVLKKLLQITQNYGVQDVLLDCLRVHNGDIYYCYDSWMNNSFSIVISDQNELQNYYFSDEDLERIKAIVQSKQNNLRICARHTKKSIYFRIFLMILHLGSSNMKERNYEYGAYRLNKSHLSLRLQYFCSRYNTKGLGALVKKVIQDQRYSMEEIWRINIPEISCCYPSQKILTIRSTYRIPDHKRNKTKNSENSDQSPTMNSQILKLNNSMISNFSTSSNKEEEPLIDRKVSRLVCNTIYAKQQNDQSLLSKSNFLDQTMKSKKSGQKKYNVHPSPKKQAFNLKNILIGNTEVPKLCIKVLKYLGLQQYLPENKYECKILQILDNIHIKTNWVKQFYQNGSIYFGQMVQNKKEGKGLYLFNSNDFYFGDWVENFMQGYGIYIFVSGEVYQGQLKKGNKQGHGKCIYPDGREYEGSWIKNNKIGLGKVKFPNNVTFVGLFKPHQSQTQGLFIGPFGQDQKPLWENRGILQKYHWEKNTLIKNNKNEIIQKKQKLMHCKNEFYNQFRDSRGNLFEGEMKDNLRQGFGIQQSQKETYQGEWKADKKQGCGTLFIKNAFHLSGVWKNNMMIKYKQEQDQDIM